MINPNEWKWTDQLEEWDRRGCVFNTFENAKGDKLELWNFGNHVDVYLNERQIYSDEISDEAVEELLRET